MNRARERSRKQIYWRRLRMQRRKEFKKGRGVEANREREEKRSGKGMLIEDTLNVFKLLYGGYNLFSH